MQKHLKNILDIQYQIGYLHSAMLRKEIVQSSVVSKYQRPSVVMNINETFYKLKRSSVRIFIPGMCSRNKLYE